MDGPFSRHLLLAPLLALAACATPEPPPAAPPRAAPAAPKPVAPKPAPKPGWTPRKVVADAVEVPGGSIAARPGETLAMVAARAGVSPGALAAANTLVPPYALKAGQTLTIPAGRSHRVKPGETGIAIARAYGVGWNSVIAANRLQPPYMLRAGQRLLLPSRQSVAAMSLEARAAAFRIDINDLLTGAEPAAVAAKPKPVAEPAAFTGRFIWPLEGRILSAFGPKPGGRFNDGVNIKATTGAPVRAAADGVVAYAGDAIDGFGGLLLVKHGDGWVTAYAHNEALLAARGQRVKRGQVIARAGSTGSVDEPQLHFEIRRGKTPLDPLKQLPARGMGNRS